MTIGPELMMAEAARMSPDTFDHGTCVCGLSIIKSKEFPDSGWFHSTGERGCYAALFYVDRDKWRNNEVFSARVNPAFLT
jgi:hypothetical protein